MRMPSTAVGVLHFTVLSITDFSSFVFQVISHSMSFATSFLSTFYLDIVKDRLYVEERDNIKRRAAQTVIYEVCSWLDEACFNLVW